ncbi:MAG: tape measure protein, partial [Dolichospermum sp.]
MNLGELIVELSLDYADFNQSLEKAKKAASSAAASIEKSFDKISLLVEVDDSALYDLNKHLDLKYKHFKEVNQYFKNNPITPTVDDDELTELNKTLKNLTKNKHTVTIEQRINAKLTDSSKRDIANSVTEGVADGVEKGVAKGLHDMDKMIAKAVTDGLRAGEKSFSGTSSGTSTSSPSRGSGDSIGDVVYEIKYGFDTLQKEIGNQLIGDAIKILLKPGKDLLQGFTEGITNDIGKQLSKGIQETFGKQLGADFKKMGEQAGNSVLNAFGIKVKKENKLLTAISDGSQIAVKSLGKSVERYAVRKLNAALTDSLDDIFSELFSLDVGTSSKRKTQAQVRKTRVYRRTRQNTSPTSTSYTSEEIPDPWGDVPQVQIQPLNISDIAKKTTLLSVPNVKKKRKEAEKVLLENSFTPFEKAAHESNKQFGYVINEFGKINVANSIVGGGNQTVKRVASEITKIKTVHQKAYSTFKKLLDSAQELGDYGLVDRIYRDFVKNSETAKTQIDKLLKEGKDAGLTQHGYNKLATAKSGISRSIGKSSGSIPSKYQAIGRQAESEAVAIGKNVIGGLGIGADNKAFARFGLENATAYLLAIKQAFQIKSPSKVMMGIGFNIIQGLSLGLNSQKTSLAHTSESIASTIKKGFQNVKLMQSESLKIDIDPQIQSIYSQSLKQTKPTLPGVILGTAMMGAANLGILPNSISTPVKHLGAYYQGATDSHQLDSGIGTQSAMLAIYSSMFDHVMQTRNLRIPDNFQVGSGVVNAVGVSSYMPQLYYTLGGYQYNRTKDGGLRTNDIYDWTHDIHKITEFKLPFKLGSKVASIFEKLPILPKLIGVEYDKQLDAYVKKNTSGETLFGFSKSTQSKGFLLGDSIHSSIGGKPYLQGYNIDAKKLKSLQETAKTVFHEVSGDPDAFFNHAAIKQHTSNAAKGIGINLIKSIGQGILGSYSSVFNILNSFGKSAINVIKKIFGIASPSKVMQSIGLDIGKGFENGAVASLGLANKRIADLILKTFQNLSQSLIKSFTGTQKQGNATLGEFISNALKAGGGSLLSSAGIGKTGIGSIIGNLASGNTAALIPQLMRLLIPVLGLKGLNLGDTIVKILNNNLAIKPGFLNDLFKSLTGIKLEKTGFMSVVTNTLGISKGSKSPITSPMEVINKQIEKNLGSVGTGGSIPKLVENTGQMLVSAVLKQFGVSDVVNVAIEAMVKGKIANFANLDIFTKTGGKGIGGRIRGIAESYSQGDVEGVIGKSSKLAGTILRTIGFKVDMKQLNLVMGTAIAGITAFHKAFTKEGLGIGQALIKGFKEAMKNWGNVFDDMKIKAKQATKMDVLDDLTANIKKKIKQGTVVSRETFGEFFDALGKRFKDTKLNGDKDGVFGNIMSFVASISTMIAPITTMAASLLPLLIPLMPLMGALGGLAIMVGRHISGLANSIKEVEPLQRRLNFLGGSPAGGDREMKYAQGVTNKLNVPVKEGIDAYSQLAIAARGTKLEGDGVKSLFEGISASLSALGITGQDASLVFMAYTQILAKGKLSMEELRQQLGEKFPPAMGVFAKSLGVSVGELNQLISKGAILSEDILPKVAKTLNEDYGKAAANSAGSFTVALTRLGNTGFDIAIKLTKAFGGIFTDFTNLGANVLGIFRDSLEQLIPLFSSLMIGVTAVVGVGLATILSASPIATFLATAQNMIVVGLGSLMVNLAPFYAGIIADIADTWLGAQNDLMENMLKGVGNMVVALIVAIDNGTRDAFDNSLFSDFVGKQQGSNPFQGLIDGLTGLFRIIPSGLVEMGALVMMFEQVLVLAKMLVVPTLLGSLKGLMAIISNFAGMLRPINTIIPELFVNTSGIYRNAEASRRSLLPRPTNGTPIAATPKPTAAIPKPTFTEPIHNTWNKFTQGINGAKLKVSDFTTDTWNKFTQGINGAKLKVNDFTTDTWNKFTQGINGAKPKISDFTTNTWNKFIQGIDSTKLRVNDFTANTWNRFTQGINDAKLKVNDFTANTWNKFTQGIDKAKAFISQITWAGFMQKIDNAKTSIKNFGSNISTGFTQGINDVKLRVNDFTTNTWNRFTQGIDKAKTSISQ